MRAQGSDRVLILAHGAGSSADFLRRAFPSGTCGVPVQYLDDRTGDPARIAARLQQRARAARATGAEVVLGGVSIGAHAAAAAALAAPADLVHGCVLVMPAWSGDPAHDSPTALAAAEIGALGARQVLHRIDQDPTLHGDWVAAELHRAWQARPTLAAELATASRSRAPRTEELRCLAGPALLLALADDPVHPVAVARSWAAAIPQSRLAVLGRNDPARDLAVFGRLVGAWLGSRFSAPL